MGLSLKLLKYQAIELNELLTILKDRNVTEFVGKTIETDYCYPELNSVLQDQFKINHSHIARRLSNACMFYIYIYIYIYKLALGSKEFEGLPQIHTKIRISKDKRQKFAIKITELAFSSFGIVGYALTFEQVQKWSSSKTPEIKNTSNMLKEYKRQPHFKFHYDNKYGRYTRGIDKIHQDQVTIY